ncbi:MAG TPA: carboxypeptidase regulatory-like domain-containing protein, partial [Thermoanaerobaculia bacterium]|nr:carboxypeptidase regulatory-like domain-containing protein [Thermoanaerobaculia bacterium]
MIASVGAAGFVGALGLSAIFTTADTSSGVVYWKTDGTAAGTVKLLTIPYSGNAGWYVQPVFADSRLYVLVQLSYSGPVELYVTDGTTGGSKDLGKVPAHLSPTPVGVKGFLYFLGQDESVGPQLWVSDGTPIGTHMMRRGVECPGSSCGPAPTAFLRAGPHAMFLTRDSLWTIGDRGSTIQQVASITSPAVYASSPAAPRAYISANDGLWSTDGTAAGTAAITGVTAVYPEVILDNGRLVFFRSNSSGLELWTTDGTSGGSVKVGALAPSSSTSIVAATGNKVFLAGASSTTGTELWLADLDNLTLALVDDIDARIGINGPYSGSPGPGVALGSKVIFPATDLRGRELWQSDGTTAGTTLLANIAPDPGGGVISGTVRIAEDGSALPSATVVLCSPSGISCDSLFADSAGHYHFDGVIPGTYKVGAASYLYNSQSENVSVTAGAELTGVDFSLIRGGRISGTVMRASTGQPIGSNNGAVTVSIFDASGLRVDVQNAGYSNGTYISRGLPTGMYYAVATGHYFSSGEPAVDQTYKNHDCSSTVCSWQNGDAISVTNGITTAGVDFALHAYGTIAGKIRDDGGNPLTRFPVYFLPQGSSDATISVQTDNNGAYVSPPLNPGSYYVLTSGSGFDTRVYPNGTCSSVFSCTPAGGSPVNVAIDGATTGIDFQIAPAKGRIVGTIRDSNGNLFLGVTVQIRDAAGYYISAYGGPAQTDAAGHYEFVDLPDGTYYVHAFDELYPGVDCFDNPCSTAGATPIVLTAGHSVRADMQLLSQRTTIGGHLLDSVTKQRLTVGTVFLFDASGRGIANDFVDGTAYSITTVGRSKSYFIGGLSGGYDSAIYPNVRWAFCSGCSAPPGGTAIPAGTSTNIDISLDRRASITGTVTDAATGKPVPNVEVLFYWANG